MPPKRKTSEKGGAAKKAKVAEKGDPKQIVEDLLKDKQSYCEELGIDIKSGKSDAVFQWLCCSIIFGNRLSEKTTIRAAKGLLNCGLVDPQSVKETSLQDKIGALNSEGNVQRGPSMSERLEETAKVVLEKYDGDLNKLRDAANKDLNKEKKLLKEFKGVGEMGVNIFLREAQVAWEEVYPFADKRTLDMAKQRGLPSKSAKELAELVDDDRGKFVELLGAVVKTNLRGDEESITVGNEKGDEGGAKNEATGSGENGAQEENQEGTKESNTEEADGKKTAEETTEAE